MRQKAMDVNKLKEKLQGAIEAEATMAVCYGRVAELIKNRKVRSQFYRFSKEAEENKELLCSRLNKLGLPEAECKNACRFCKLRPESFSLIGAVEMGLETTKLAAKFYKELSAKCDSPHDKGLFNVLFKDHLRRQVALKREKKFGHSDEESPFATHCIPKILPKLWK